MKQISVVETTTSSRPAFMGATAALAPFVMASSVLLFGGRWGGSKTPPCTIWIGHVQGLARRRVEASIAGMPPRSPLADVVDFYDRHPISAPQILDALRRQGKAGPPLDLDDLGELDHDHYGGRAAVEALARRAAIGPGARVLDVCAGLAGPARFLAGRFGVHVLALDLNAGRCAGGARLTRLVGLEALLRPSRAEGTGV